MQPTSSPAVPTFRLGIAMAGAVSAGAYTAGVIDYLLETLDKWEGAKARNRELGPEHPAYDHSIPMHNVVIEVIGGASAGAMTAAVATMALAKGLKPVKQCPAPGTATGNLLYDAWVGLNDDEGALTLNQMFATDDLTEGQPLRSILNSLPIRRIGEKASEAVDGVGQWPAYVSPSLQVLLTLSNLRGIPVSLAFQSDDTSQLARMRAELLSAETLEEINAVVDKYPGAFHTMQIHKTTAHFRLELPAQDGPEAEPPAHIMPLNLARLADREKLVEYAIASGAFPVALSPVDFAMDEAEFGEKGPAPAPDRAYFLEQIKRDFPNESAHLLSAIDKHYKYTAVDGGTLNNEPFGEVMELLREGGTDQDNYALLVIDPFPSSQKVTAYEFPESLGGVAGQLIGALRAQAMVKEQEIRKGFADDYTVAMIMPSRNETGPDGTVGPAQYPIACGSLEGFGGFFHREFREHDFFLGRKNCQAFLRKHFTANESQLQRAGVLEGYVSPTATRTRSLSATAISPESQLYQRFGYEPASAEGRTQEIQPATRRSRSGMSPEKPKEARFPIVPDLSVGRKEELTAAYTEAKAAIPNYESVKIDAQKLKAYQPKLMARFAGILDHYLKYPLPGLGVTFRQLSWGSLIGWCVLMALLVSFDLPGFLVAIMGVLMSLMAMPLLIDWIARPFLLRLASHWVFKVIAEQFKKHGLLRE